MKASIRLLVLADWLRDSGYEVTGPTEDERVVFVTVDDNGGVHLSAPDQSEPSSS